MATKRDDMKLGDYQNGRRAVWVPCAEDEDPRPWLAQRPALVPKRRRHEHAHDTDAKLKGGA